MPPLADALFAVPYFVIPASHFVIPGGRMPSADALFAVP
jgi:hypothetical protein